MPTIQHLLEENKLIFQILIAIMEMGLGFILGPIVRNWIVRMHPRGIDKGVLTFTGSLANALIRFLAIVIALAQLGVNMDVIVGAFSAVGLGVSLALKENMANVAGGLQILITRPFSVGDYIGIDGEEGSVKQVEIMFTTLETLNGQEVIIPNATLVSNTVINYTINKKRRVVIDVPVSCDGDYDSFRTEMVKIMKAHKDAYQDPAPTTMVTGFTPEGNGMIIRCICYCDNTNYWELLFDLNEQVQKQRSALKLSQPVSVVQVNGE